LKLIVEVEVEATIQIEETSPNSVGSLDRIREVIVVREEVGEVGRN
jgi:hypothetical protein